MLGAIVGDIAGSIYEFNNYRSKDFELLSPMCYFTDDTVMTIAVFRVLLKSKPKGYKNLKENVIKEMQSYGKLYPDAGYGLRFREWIYDKKALPYNSFGNGAAMRVSAVAYFANSLEEVKQLSKIVTEVSHNHSEGLKGAEATAVAIYLALHNCSKEEIKQYIEENYYSLDFDYKELQDFYYFNETCQGTVPQAIYCFLISDSFTDCIRTSISIGGDSDTLSAISCAIAEAYYGVPDYIKEKALNFLDKRLLKDYSDFYKFFEEEFIINK